MSRVVFLVTGLDTGGAEMMVAKLAGQLLHRWDVVVVSIVRPGAVGQRLVREGIRVRSLNLTPGVWDPRAVTRLWRMIKDERPSLIHAHLFHANLLGRIVGRLARIPVISTIHNVNFGGGRRELLLRLTDRLSCYTFVVSEQVDREMRRRRVVSVKRLRVLNNFVDTRYFSPSPKKEARSKLGLSLQEKVILSVGRLEPQKDVSTLIQALRLVADAGIVCKCLIAGKGRLQNDLSQEITQLGLEDYVVLLGEREDIKDLLAAADLFVLSSKWEGLPTAILEAMGMELPVVASAVGGVPEVVLDGRTGRLVPPTDPFRLAQAIVGIVSMSAQEREVMGRVGRRLVKGKYSLDKAIHEVGELYDAILQDPHYSG